MVKISCICTRNECNEEKSANIYRIMSLVTVVSCGNSILSVFVKEFNSKIMSFSGDVFLGFQVISILKGKT